MYFPKPNGMSFLFPREMGNVTVLVSHSNHILGGEQDEWDWVFPREQGRKKMLLHFVLSLRAWPLIAASLITQYLNPLSLGPLQQPAGEMSPSLTPVWSLYCTEVKSQGHLIHPCFQETQSVRHGEFAPRASLVFSSPRSYFH